MHTVSTLEEGRALLSARARELVSPPYAGCYAGVHYYRKLVDALEAEFPHVPFHFTLDCGDDAAIAFEAQRMGLCVRGIAL